MWFHCFSQVFFSFLFHSFIFCLLLVLFCCLVWVSFALLSLETSGGNSRLFENFFFSQKHILVLYISSMYILTEVHPAKLPCCIFIFIQSNPFSYSFLILVLTSELLTDLNSNVKANGKRRNGIVEIEILFFIGSLLGLKHSTECF